MMCILQPSSSIYSVARWNINVHEVHGILFGFSQESNQLGFAELIPSMTDRNTTCDMVFCLAFFNAFK